MKRIEGRHDLAKTEQGVIVNIDKTSYDRAIQRKKERDKAKDFEARLQRIESLLERLLGDGR